MGKSTSQNWVLPGWELTSASLCYEAIDVWNSADVHTFIHSNTRIPQNVPCNITKWQPIGGGGTRKGYAVDVVSGDEMSTRLFTQWWVGRIVFSLDGNQIVSYDPRAIYLWITFGNAMLAPMQGHGRAVSTVAFFSDAKSIAHPVQRIRPSVYGT